MRYLFLLALIGWSLIFSFSACRKDSSSMKHTSTPRLISFKELEGLDTTQPGSGKEYLAYNFIYTADKLTRINITKRGEPDGYRIIAYQNNLPASELIYDRDDQLQCAYKFHFQQGSKRISSINFEYFNVTSSVQAQYVFHYNNTNQVDTLTTFYHGVKTGFITYEYVTETGEEKVLVNHFEINSTQTKKPLKYAIEEIIYDDKNSPDMWPVFTFSQTHEEPLNLTSPISSHNIKRFIYRSLNYSRSDLTHNKLVYDTLYPTFTAANTYNDNGYIKFHSEIRPSGVNPEPFSFTYDNQ